MLADHVGREQVIEALGRRWTLSRWDRSIWRDLLEWAKPRVPDPVATAKRMMEALPEKHHADIVSAALELTQQPLGIEHPGVQAVVWSMEGMAKLCHLLLRKHHPGVTEDEAWDVAQEVGAQEMKRKMERAEGKVPPRPEGNGEAPASTD